VLGIGAYNRYWLVSQANPNGSQGSRNVGVESLILLMGVLALASLHNTLRARTACRFPYLGEAEKREEAQSESPIYRRRY
jgi:hypothetical protein